MNGSMYQDPNEFEWFGTLADAGREASELQGQQVSEKWGKEVEERILTMLPERLDPEDVDPRALANLCGLYHANPVAFSRVQSAVTDLLLDLTVQRALQTTRFYSDLYGASAGGGKVGLDDLSNMPIVSRELVTGAGQSIRSTGSYSNTFNTGGTSTGRALLIDHSIEEFEIARAFTETIRGFPSRCDLQSRYSSPIVLTIGSHVHGQSQRTPPGHNIVDLRFSGAFRKAVNLLEREYEFDGETCRVTSVTGDLYGIVCLTHYLRHEGHHELAAPVEVLSLTGAYLSEYTRKWLTEFWDCRISNAYSFSELPLHALQCPDCGLFHFSTHGIAEVVDIDEGTPIEKGRGKLLLTGFFPFVQYVPLIRYEVGDLVEVVPWSCETHPKGYRILGRTNSFLRVENDELGGRFVGMAEIYEVLDGIAEVNRPLLDVTSIPVSSRTVATDPSFEIREGKDHSEILVELRFSPDAFPQRAKELAALIQSELVERYPPLVRGFEQGRLSIRTLAPGMLAR